MIRLVQVQHDGGERRVARVEDDRLRVLAGASVYEYAQAALQNGESLAGVIERAASASAQMLDYDALYAHSGEWRLLPAWDHPGEPARCLVSGTGLTHRKSADNRNAMHQAAAAPNAPAPPADIPPSPAPTDAKPTDSMTMYAWGEQGGRPQPGNIGAQPEWFYKGNGTILRAHGQTLDIPAYAEDGGEEAEIAGVYLIDAQGDPRRVGFAQANEFSDHVMEARNYLYLAPSKLRACALGPELLVPDTNENESEDVFADVRGDVVLMRQNHTLWRQEIRSGSANMVHTLANLEHHHFKYAAHRRPGDAHVHFFGTGGFSFGSGVALVDGDTMTVSFDGYGRPLVNTVRVEAGLPTLREARPI